MCGICGIIGLVKDNQNRVKTMVKKMEHRGPDDHGVFKDGSVGLGMARLAIIDLTAAGHQPMSNQAGTIWIVFNGEMYNYLEEKKVLVGKGYHFRSNSDTEVLLSMYEEYGDDFVLRVRGMFAIAIYDRRFGQERLVMVRDQLGVKPLLYWHQNKTLVFASEIKAILASGLVPRKIDPESVRLLVTYGSVTQPRTIIQDVKMLLPAHRLIYEKNKVRLEKYWSLGVDRVAGLRHEPYTVQLTTLKSTLEDSVKRQMISDVPIGAFLSGGIDSGLLVAIMTRVAKSKVKTYSVGFQLEGSHIDETDDARRVAKYLGTSHSRVEVTAGDIKKDIRKIAKFLDQPTVDGVNAYYISQAAAKGVTVAISGTGGDELFAGYPWFINLTRTSPDSGFIAQLAQKGIFNSLSLGRYASQLESLRRSGGFLAKYSREYSIFGSIRGAKILSKKIRQSSTIGREPSYDINIPDDISYFEPIDRVTALILRGYTQNQLLRDIDAASMAHSLEVRVPFLDSKVADVALSLSSNTKLGKVSSIADSTKVTYRSSGAKKILVDIATKWLPPDIDQQEKRGFAMPFDSWLRTSLKEMVDKTLSRSVVEKRGIFDPTEVGRLKAQFEAGNMSWPSIWLLMMTELWCQEVLDVR